MNKSCKNPTVLKTTSRLSFLFFISNRFVFGVKRPLRLIGYNFGSCQIHLRLAIIFQSRGSLSIFSPKHSQLSYILSTDAFALPYPKSYDCFITLLTVFSLSNENYSFCFSTTIPVNSNYNPLLSGGGRGERKEK